MAGSPAAQIQECVEGYLFSGPPTQILVLRRPPGRGRIWVPVSGKVEPSDPDFDSALRRELVEETGFTDPVRIFPLDWKVEFEGPDGRTWRLHGFGVELRSASAPTLSAEHEAFAWVPVEEARSRLHYPDNREAVQRLAHHLEGEGRPPAPPTL